MAFDPPSASPECHHGQLRRQCNVCELEADVTRLIAERDAALSGKEDMRHAIITWKEIATKAKSERDAAVERTMLEAKAHNAARARISELEGAGDSLAVGLLDAHARVSRLEAALREMQPMIHTSHGGRIEDCFWVPCRIIVAALSPAPPTNEVDHG